MHMPKKPPFFNSDNNIISMLMLFLAICVLIAAFQIKDAQNDCKKQRNLDKNYPLTLRDIVGMTRNEIENLPVGYYLVDIVYDLSKEVSTYRELYKKDRLPLSNWIAK